MEDREKYSRQIIKEFCKDINADGVKKHVISKADSQKIVSRYADFFNKIFFDVEIRHFWTHDKYKTLGDFLKHASNKGLKIGYGYRFDSDKNDCLRLAYIDNKEDSGIFSHMFFDVSQNGAFSVHFFEEYLDNNNIDKYINGISISIFFSDNEISFLYNQNDYNNFINQDILYKTLEDFEGQKYQDRYIAAMTDLFGEDYKKHYETIKKETEDECRAEQGKDKQNTDFEL